MRRSTWCTETYRTHEGTRCARSKRRFTGDHGTFKWSVVDDADSYCTTTTTYQDISVIFPLLVISGVHNIEFSILYRFKPFLIRYSNSRGSDNCFLSERTFHGLDLSADSGSDVYAMPQEQGCSAVSNTPWIESGKCLCLDVKLVTSPNVCK